MDKHRFNLVIPEPIWEQITQVAAHHRRSITQEILFALECHIAKQNGWPPPARRENAPEPGHE